MDIEVFFNASISCITHRRVPVLEPQKFIINWKSARAIAQLGRISGYCKFETLLSPRGQGIISNFNCTLILAHCIAAAHEDACCFDMNLERHQTCLYFTDCQTIVSVTSANLKTRPLLRFLQLL